MGIGRVIVDIVKVSDHRWWVNTLDHYHIHCAPMTEVLNARTVAVYCDPKGHALEVGDSFWWEDDHCFWSSAKRPHRSDIRLPKLSASGMAHPDCLSNATPSGR